MSSARTHRHHPGVVGARGAPSSFAQAAMLFACGFLMIVIPIDILQRRGLLVGLQDRLNHHGTVEPDPVPILAPVVDPIVDRAPSSGSPLQAPAAAPTHIAPAPPATTPEWPMVIRSILSLCFVSALVACNALVGIEEGHLGKSELTTQPGGGSAKPGSAGAQVECHAGFADCNSDPTDGCETDLSKPAHCGACGTVCASTTPMCLPGASGFTCGSSCTPRAPTLCAMTCTDLNGDPDHCGACDHACPEVSNGEATCEKATCGIACAKDFHLCADACVSSKSTASCGTSCSPCPTAPNAEADCEKNKCELKCRAAFGNCDGDDTNGCEVPLGTTANCGGCGVACAVTQACVNGACT